MELDSKTDEELNKMLAEVQVFLSNVRRKGGHSSRHIKAKYYPYECIAQQAFVRIKEELLNRRHREAIRNAPEWLKELLDE